MNKKPITPGEIRARNENLDSVEKCLLHLLRNPPTSPVGRLWERDLKVMARNLGYEFADRPSIERCKSDESPVFFCGEKITTIS